MWDRASAFVVDLRLPERARALGARLERRFRLRERLGDLRERPRRHLVIVSAGGLVAAGALATVIVIALSGSQTEKKPQSAPHRAALQAAGFRVRMGRILAPDGQPFTVKGVAAAYGTFAGGDQGGLGAVNFDSARNDFAVLQGLGANTVRIIVTPATAAPAQFDRLRQVVRWARDRKLVVEIANAFSDPPTSLPWIERLARTYKDDPYVWLEPLNEPNCSPTPNALCGNWKAWQTEQRAFIRAIRAAGMSSPIVVNMPNWSSSVEQVASYPLGDQNLVYGVHAYGHDNTGVTPQDVVNYQRSVSSSDGPIAVTVDELGSWNGPQFVNSISWAEQYLRLVRDSVLHERVDGVIGFLWRWSDPNTMTEGGRLTAWGKLFVDGYLKPVPGGG
jgi:hypothetical protein